MDEDLWIHMPCGLLRLELVLNACKRLEVRKYKRARQMKLGSFAAVD